LPALQPQLQSQQQQQQQRPKNSLAARLAKLGMVPAAITAAVDREATEGKQG
jgi:hypothetical protein